MSRLLAISQLCIFDPFFTTKQAQGSGFGLSISRQIVSRAGGQITAQSTPGAGSRFDVRLPVQENETDTDLDRMSRNLAANTPGA